MRYVILTWPSSKRLIVSSKSAGQTAVTLICGTLFVVNVDFRQWVYATIYSVKKYERSSINRRRRRCVLADIRFMSSINQKYIAHNTRFPEDTGRKLCMFDTWPCDIFFFVAATLSTNNVAWKIYNVYDESNQAHNGYPFTTCERKARNRESAHTLSSTIHEFTVNLLRFGGEMRKLKTVQET